MFTDFMSLREVRTECYYGGRGAHDQPLAKGGGAEFEVTPLPRTVPNGMYCKTTVHVTVRITKICFVSLDRLSRFC